MIAAIQIHPHDVRDEGAERVVENIREKAGITIISPEVSALEERHPYPRGILPHNPVRGSLVSTATLEVPLNLNGALPHTPLKGLGPLRIPFNPRLSDEALKGEDYILELVQAASRSGCRVVPWLKGLNAVFDGDIDSYCVQTLEDRLVPTWLCPSKPESLSYVAALTKSVMERYEVDTVLLDRMRYPDWSGAEVLPERMLACFCPECRRLMSAEGINVDTLVKTLRLRKKLARSGKEEFPPEPDELQLITAWLAFRRKRITDLTAAVREEIKSFAQNAKLWLNLWPPSFAPFLGQDYSALGKLCDGAKHFPYHRLGGGADLKGLTEAMTPDERGQEHIFSRLLSLLNLPYNMKLREFASDGFPVDFVRTETAKGKEAFGLGKAPVFSGIQIWDIPEDEIEPACKAALSGGADGFFFYCYGWATLGALSEVGRILKNLRGV